MENNTFALATKQKLRFGNLSTEDLWDLSLKDLDAIAIKVDATIESKGKSFLENPDPRASRQQKEQQLMLEVLKAVITVKQDENKERLANSTKEGQKAFLKSLLEKKKMESMEALTTEEIEAQLASIQ